MGKYSKGKALKVAQGNLQTQQGITPEQINAEMGRLKGMRPEQIQALNAQHLAGMPPAVNQPAPMPPGGYNMGNDALMPPGDMQHIQPYPGRYPRPRPMPGPGGQMGIPSMPYQPQPINSAGLDQLTQALGGTQAMMPNYSKPQQVPSGFFSNIKW